MASEMVNDAIDDAMDDEEAEEETEDLVSQVLLEMAWVAILKNFSNCDNFGPSNRRS
jgi:hypothetical protein